MQKWRNFGDVSFLSEGGTMVRKAWSDTVLAEYPSLASMYECLMLSPIQDEDIEGDVLAHLKIVDIQDFTDEETAEKMLRVFGDVPDDEYAFAAYCAEYAGLEVGLDGAYSQKGMYATKTDYLLSREDARKWLMDLEVPDKYIK